MTAGVLRLVQEHSASRWESEPWDILGLRISLRVTRRNVRGRKETLVREYLINGRRRGYNAILYALRKREREMLNEART